METISKYYNIETETYKLYHMIYLLAQRLDVNNTQDTNDFWINEIQKEINNTKK